MFISYSHKNKTVVHKVHEELEKRNIRTWIDKEEIELADKQVEKMANGINESKVALCFFSKDYHKSEFCKLELKYTFEKDMDKEMKCIYITIEDEKQERPEWVKFITVDSNYLYAHKAPNTFDPWSDALFKKLADKIVDLKEHFENDSSPVPSPEPYVK